MKASSHRKCKHSHFHAPMNIFNNPLKHLLLIVLLFTSLFTHAQTETEPIKLKKFIKKEKGKLGIKNGKEWAVAAAYDKITGLEIYNNGENPVNYYYYKGIKGDKFDLIFAKNIESTPEFKMIATDVTEVDWMSTSVENEPEEYILFKKNDKWGWFIRKAKIRKMTESSYLENYIHEARYDSKPETQMLYYASSEFTEYSNINFLVDSMGQKGLTGFNGERIFKCGPYTRFTWNKELRIFTIKGTNGLMGYALKGVIVEPQYQSIKKSENHQADFACTLPDGKVDYYIGTKSANQRALASGERFLQVKAEADEKQRAENAKIFDFYYDENQKLFGVKDKNGKIVVQPKYNLYSGGLNSIYEITIGKKSGFFDLKQAKEIIPVIYTNSRTIFSENKVAVELDGKWGYIDITGKTVIPFQFEYAENFAGGEAKVILNGKMTLIDSKGNEIK